MKTWNRNTEHRIDTFLDTLYPNDGPGAAIAISIEDKIVYENGFGLANIEWSVPMPADAVLPIGSITKQFTAVAILLLIEDDKLEINTPLNEVLDDYPETEQEIFIHHLLSHTSGIKDIAEEAEWDDLVSKERSHEEMFKFFANHSEYIEPGSEWKYGNTGYHLLGWVIEKVSGQPYGEFIAERIFEPLKMTNSTFLRDGSSAISNFATGYDYTDAGVKRGRWIPWSIPYSAGAIMSTVGDMAIWNRAIHQNGFLSPDLYRLATTPTLLNSEEKINYGFGWCVTEYNGEKMIEHGGSIVGYVGYNLVFPEHELSVILLTNGREHPRLSIIEKPYHIASLCLGIDRPPAIALTKEQLKEYCGKYQFVEKQVIEVTAGKDGLQFPWAKADRETYVPIDPDRFTYKDFLTSTVRQFERDADGKIESLQTKNHLSKGKSAIKLSDQSTD